MSDMEFLSGGGEMGARIRAYPWARTTLGDPSRWPQGLRTALRVLLTTQHPVFIFWGPELLCFYNDAYSQSLGPEKHPSALGRPGLTVWPEIWHIIGPQIEHVMQGKGATWHENQLVPIIRHGRLEDVYWTYSYGPIDEPNASHGVGGVLVICTETTRLVQTERRMEAELRQFAELFDLSPTFIALLRGPEHTFELVNPTYERIVGHRPIIGKTVAEALPEAVEQGYLKLLDEVYRTGKPFSATGAKYAVQITPGAAAVDRYLDFVYQPITDSQGRVTGVFVQGADVTERALVEAALREREEQLREANATLERRIARRTSQLHLQENLVRTVYQHSSECHAVMVEAGDGRFRYEEVNPATLRLYGRTREEVIGSTFEELFGPDVAASLNHHLTACLTSGAHYRYERVQGERIIEAVATPVPDEPGIPRRIVVSARDVTERRRLEEELRQAQKMEAVGQLTGGLAHDFNNLLAGIIGSLEMLTTRLGQGRIQEVGKYVIAAQGAAKRAAALTHRLLAFSRRQTLDPRPIDVNRLVADLEDLVQRTVGPEIKVEFVGAPDAWHTLVDPSQLESALLNLCINARDAMPDGGTLRIETCNCRIDERVGGERDFQPGPYLSLSVSDSGTGMTPEVMSRAFDPFFTTKPLGQGTGLGLSMVYGFARQSGGQVRIHSEVGKGTTVYLYLPRYEGPALVVEMADMPVRILRPPEGATVLVVDDEATVRIPLVEALQDAGYIAIEAVDGIVGLQVLQSEQRIDLLITDVGLPSGINGRQLADAGRSLRPGLDVLFVTGYSANVVIDHKHPERDFHVLTKPFTMEDVVRRVGTIVSRR